MFKIPTLFIRNPERRSEVINKVNPECEWVIRGEGWATQKLDGTAVMVDRKGRFWKRRTIRENTPHPTEFLFCETDLSTGKSFGWVPVTDDDKWHMEAIATAVMGDRALLAGTYELVGPKINGNPEGFNSHVLVSHNIAKVFYDAPRTFAELRMWLDGRDIEGLVWHHASGRKAKLKLRDFGLNRKNQKGG